MLQMLNGVVDWVGTGCSEVGVHTLQAQSLSDRLELLSPEAHAGSSGATLDISRSHWLFR